MADVSATVWLGDKSGNTLFEELKFCRGNFAPKDSDICQSIVFKVKETQMRRRFVRCLENGKTKEYETKQYFHVTLFAKADAPAPCVLKAIYYDADNEPDDEYMYEVTLQAGQSHTLEMPLHKAQGDPPDSWRFYDAQTDKCVCQLSFELDFPDGR